MFSTKLTFSKLPPEWQANRELKQWLMISSTTTKSEIVASRFWNHCSSIVSHSTSKTSTINQLNHDWDKRFEDRKIKNQTVVYTTTKCHFTSLIEREQLRDLRIWKTHVQSVQNFCARVSFIVKYANLGRCPHGRDGCLSSLITSSCCPLSPTPPSAGGLTKQGEPAWLSETSFQQPFQEASNLNFIARIWQEAERGFLR